MKKLLAGVLCLTLAGTTTFAQRDKPAAKFSKEIKASSIKEKLTIIASDEMQGRATATEGQRKAAAYIEAQFKALGLQPGTTNGFQQQYPVYYDTISQAKLSVNGKAFSFGKDFVIGLEQLADTTAAIKEIVLAGYGITDSIYDDYRDLDVKGKCVLIAEGEPKLENGNYLLTGTTKASRSAGQFVKLTNAMKHGAAMVLYYRQAPQSSFPALALKSGQYFYPKKQNGKFGINSITINDQVLEAIAEGLSKDLDGMIEAGNSLSTTLTTDINITLEKKQLNVFSSNVIGVLPGTDKKDEYVFITAHYDHLGISSTGKIFYGADDDGSGTAAVIEMAKAFKAASDKGKGPRRSIVFMTVSGEEKGLWGSSYYTDNPTVSLPKVSADLNIDMIGRVDTSYRGNPNNYLYVIGDDKISSDLTPITDSINKAYLKMELDRKYNDPSDPNRIFYRSDHYNFAKHNVPIIFYFSGLHPDYHRTTDTVDKIRFDLMEKRTRLIFLTGWAIANRDELLIRDRPLK
ncbi:M28 family peptidase [Filimonas effusa]|uniref:M28 family peptidase n=1 Tax=Filimonas effusa TaxID=2508721 RepID=A0A4Q1CZV7_9BACT|nr:M28 family peptidase [Filimonas effusa]RXK80933.1 M28 family peptidase [Filimonas effusa]